MTKYRSYHGGTLGALNATGDYRRIYAGATQCLFYNDNAHSMSPEPGVSGFVRFADPYPYGYSNGATEDEVPALS